MRGKSNSFRQVTPFYPRHGIPLYEAFPLDVTNPTQAQPSGCMDVSQKVDFVSEGDQGGPFSVNQRVYTLTNTGGAPFDWTLEISEDWLVADVTSGTIDKGGTAFVTVTLQANDLPFEDDPYTASLVFTNTTNDCGSITLSASVKVNQVFEFVGNFTPEFRGASGTATLIGFDEFIDASNPPKKYRRNTIAEGYNWCTFVDSFCSGSAASFANDLNGDAFFDPITGAETLVPYFSGSTGGGGTCHVPPLLHTSDQDRFIYDTNFMTLVSQTRLKRQFSTQPACTLFGFVNYVTAGGGGSEELSEEDLEIDAIARFKLANPPGPWGPTPVDAFYGARVSGISFPFGDAEFRVTGTGFAPGATIKIIASVNSGPYPGGPLVPVANQQFITNADGSGNLSFSTSISASRGTESAIVGDVAVYEGQS